MKKYALAFITTMCCITHTFAQVISIQRYDDLKDTTKNYYISTCEEYHTLLKDRNRYNQYDSCTIDFSKYDAAGTRSHDTIRWTLVSPKRYKQLQYEDLKISDRPRWKKYTYHLLIEDTAAYNKATFSRNKSFIDTFDFKTKALIYNYVDKDCQGSYYYKVLYNPVENKILCNLIILYRGCAGTLSEESWISIIKPNPDTKIEIKECKIY